MDKEEMNRTTQEKAGAEDPERRNLALAIFGALGGAAFMHSCASSEGTVVGNPNGVVGKLPEALTGTNITWVDTIGITPGTGPDLNLRGLAGTDEAAFAVALGYKDRGDGGGGIFAWIGPENPATDDGGTIIVPGTDAGKDLREPGPHWKRIYSGAINVKWFGARGDGNMEVSPLEIGDGRFVDQVAIQCALDCAMLNAPADHGTAGIDVLIPSGQYVLNGSGQAALWIAVGNVNLIGVGGPPGGTTLKIDRIGMGASGNGCAILIESGGAIPPAPDGGPPGCGTAGTTFPTADLAAMGVTIRNLTIDANPAPGAAQDGIVVHTPLVSIYDCYIKNVSRHGILIESGCSTDFYGITRATSGPNTPFNSNANVWRLTNVRLNKIGNVPSNGDYMQGSGIFIRGSDANAGVATACYATNCNVAFHDGAAAGSVWVGCYSEACNVGFHNSATQTSVYLGCTSEDVTHGVYTMAAPLALGGSIVDTGPTGPSQRLGFNASQLSFGANQSGDGVLYGANIPGNYAYRGAIDIKRGNSAWSLAYEPFPYPVPSTQWEYVKKSWRLLHTLNGSIDCTNVDCYGGPFGWTAFDHERGGGLPFIGNPLLNSLRRWSWRQSVDQVGTVMKLYPTATEPNANVIYFHGSPVEVAPNVIRAGRAHRGRTSIVDDAKGTYPHAQTRVSVDVEFASEADMLAADVHVAGYLYIPPPPPPPELHTGNYAVKIMSSAEVTVTLVWHFEVFVPNSLTYQGGPG
jgi:hypothetical protein